MKKQKQPEMKQDLDGFTVSIDGAVRVDMRKRGAPLTADAVREFSTLLDRHYVPTDARVDVHPHRYSGSFGPGDSYASISAAFPAIVLAAAETSCPA